MSPPVPTGRGWRMGTRNEAAGRTQIPARPGPVEGSRAWAEEHVSRLGDLRGVGCFHHRSFCYSENSLLSAGGNRRREGGEGTSTRLFKQNPKNRPDPRLSLPSFHLGTALRASILPLPLGLHRIKVIISYLNQCNGHPNHLPEPQLLPP